MGSSEVVQTAYPLAQFPVATSAIIVILVSGLYLAYQWALPKPLPGIPYNSQAVKTILGDAAEVRQIRKNGGSPRGWFNEQASRHRSPLTQVFLAPLSKPAIILSEYREAQDLLLRRSKEFDRSQRNLDALAGVVPHHHISMRTSDPQFKRNKELVKDLMTPHFLNTVSAPQIYRHASKFIELWRLKAQMADGRPILAERDIHVMAFDIIKTVAVGEGDNQSMTDLYVETVRSSPSEQMGVGIDNVFVFPENKFHEDLEAHEHQQGAIGSSAMQPSPKLYHLIHNRKSIMRECFALKINMLRKQVALALKRHEAGEEVQSALDYMIQREIASAKKANRQPVFDSAQMFDELYGYIGAGHDTTSTTLQWALKYMAVHQGVQQKLREHIRTAFPTACSEGRQPTLAELIKTQVPYLEAVLEEVLRLNGPVRTVMREAMVDTTVLGHWIPKGTQVFINLGGASITSPAFPVDESLRSESARAHPDTPSSWGHDNPGAFVPERWIKTEDGAEIFDPLAGPFLSFSSGIRGCFGRRLAYVQLRVVMTLMIWNLEFGPLPEELNSWESVDSLTTKPVKCFTRLSVAK
ncbi:cytochrome P450 monooxygenase [Pseudomassariella vexata]|uniref:Cytochrome P450 monooxygenase n=1 Tax=Pseudomassariella vexata TaxID=1141098 RepID=A0A1Y2EBH4_9PEZI|nr:cytochrome P450 monooxygenase [Pseudomassariella vexata]ORY68616.1 cytochrome P450 monooxygenase [Pseudomassariella vexata]